MRPSPLHLLHRAEQVAGRVFNDGALGFITPRQLEVLIAVAANEGCNLTAVIERTGIDRSTTTELVQRLVRKGLLQKRRSRQDSSLAGGHKAASLSQQRESQPSKRR